MSINTSIHIPFLVFWVGQRCTMHCKHCCNLIPYGHQRLYDFKKSMDALTLMTKISTIGRLQIQGGEPLTHPELPQFITAIAKLPIKEISITTNGTILFSKELLNVLKNYPHISVTVSNYDTNTEVRKNVIQQLEEHSITHVLYNFLYGNMQWFNSGEFTEPRNNNDAEISEYYRHCAQKECWLLAEGKLAVCGKIIILNERYEVNSNDASNIIDFTVFSAEGNEDLAKEQLQLFIRNQSTFKEICRYCKGTEGKVRPGIQLTKEEIATYKSSRSGEHI